jgi:hypothetical protein
MGLYGLFYRALYLYFLPNFYMGKKERRQKEKQLEKGRVVRGTTAVTIGELKKILQLSALPSSARSYFW